MADIELDYEVQEEMMEEEEEQQQQGASAAAVNEAQPKTQQRLKSVVATDGASDASKKKKGRGHREMGDRGEQMAGRYESLSQGTGLGPSRSVEGWVLFVSGVHEEAQEEDITEAFGEFGDVKNVYLNLDRQTGFVKGYALVEYASQKEAQAAIDSMDGKELLTQVVKVTWAFSKGPSRAGRSGGARRR